MQNVNIIFTLGVIATRYCCEGNDIKTEINRRIAGAFCHKRCGEKLSPAKPNTKLLLISDGQLSRSQYAVIALVSHVFHFNMSSVRVSTRADAFNSSNYVARRSQRKINIRGKRFGERRTARNNYVGIHRTKHTLDVVRRCKRKR